MRIHHKSFSAMTLSVFFSIIIFPAAASFGQEPERPLANPAPHHEPAAQPNHAPKPPAHPAALADQMKIFAERQKAQWEKMLSTALKLTATLLSGNETNLLSGNRPELLSKNKTSLLSGNSPELLSKNNPKLLSENKQKLLSGNKTAIFSGNHFSFFSGLKIDIHIENTGNNNGNNSGNIPPPPPGPAPEIMEPVAQ
jgi:hypothetical protein